MHRSLFHSRLGTGWVLVILVLLGGAPASGASTQLHAKVREVSGLSATRVPVTASFAIARGTFWKDDVALYVQTSRGPVLTEAQPNILWRWDDGSIGQVLMTFFLDVGAGTTQDIYIEPSGGKLPTGVLQPSIAADSLRSFIELTDSSGTVWTGKLTGGQVLLDYLATGDRTLLNDVVGPLATEAELRGSLRSKGKNHENLTFSLRWRVYTDWPGAEIRATIYNTPLPPQKGAPFHPADVTAKSLVIKFGGDSTNDIVLTRNTVGLYDQTFVTHSAWVGEKPPRLIIRQDGAELVAAGFLPPLDFSRPISDAQAKSYADAFAKKGRISPTQYPDGIPDSAGPLEANMTITGDRDDIGPLPKWLEYAFNSTSVDAENLALAADGNAAASFSMYVTDPATQRMGVTVGAYGHKDPRKTGNPRKADRAHKPTLGYFRALVFGDRLSQEILSGTAFYDFYTWPYDKKYRYFGTRDAAWSNRDVMLAARMLPDVHPGRAVLQDILKTNLEHYASIALDPSRPLHNYGLGQWNPSGSESWPCATQESPWQLAFLTSSLGWTSKLHPEIPQAAQMFEYFGQYFVDAYVRAVGSSWTAPDGTVITWEESDSAYAIDYRVPMATYLPYIKPDGNWASTKRSEILIDSFESFDSYPALLWWKRVNMDYEFSKKSEQPAFPQAGPEPINWRPKSGTFTRPPPVSRSWEEYAIHHVAGFLAHYNVVGGVELYDRVRYAIEAENPVAGTRYVP